MEWFKFDLSVAAMGSVTLVAIIAALLKGLWFAKYKPDWRGTELVVFGICEVLVLLAKTTLVWQEGWPAPADLVAVELEAILVGFIGVCVGAFGRQAVLSILGAVGLGPDSDPAREIRAWKSLERVGYEVKRSAPYRVEAVRRPRARGG